MLINKKMGIRPSCHIDRMGDISNIVIEIH